MKEKIKYYFWRYLISIFVGTFVLALVDFLNKKDYWINGDSIIFFLVLILLDNTWFKGDGKG